MSIATTDVLIIGAGPSGLALATELTLRGHRVQLVERNTRTGMQPRAKTTNVRTMTHMRRWGLAERVRERSPLPEGYPRRVLYQTGLFDRPIFAFDDAFSATPVRRAEFPEHAEFIPQYVIEGILADHVASHPLARLEFGSELIDFGQTDADVKARIRDANGVERWIEAAFIVGADGGRSTVRRQLGIEMSGTRDIASFSTLILRIPGLIDAPGLHRALFHWIVRPDATCILGPLDQGDMWYFSRLAGHEVATEDLLQIVHRAIGRPAEIEVMARDNWVTHSLIADRYRHRRAFLIGDACHLHSPFGGHGMNLGIGDAVDLGWKLSAVLQGWASDGMLESFAIERGQAHRAVIDSSTRNATYLSEQFANEALAQAGPDADAARERAALEIETNKAPEFRSLGLVIGYHYAGSPALASAARLSAVDETCYRPTALPGHVAPHAWLPDGRSLYDLFGTGFTLIVLNDHKQAAHLRDQAQASDIPVKVIDVTDPAVLRLYGVGLALIRPDQHIAWVGDSLTDLASLAGIMRGAPMFEKTDAGA
jgi:2-polyprenyl-6-methoxyphenol hydroxylase-like FAD-dependent oxidoreductase